MDISYSITNDSCMVVVDGNSTIVRKGSPNFSPLVSACIADDHQGILNNLTIRKSLQDWARGTVGFSIDGEVVSYQGQALPDVLCKRISEMAAKGESPEPFFNFWARVQRNPSYRSVTQLWSFLQHCGIALTPDGCFLAYKGVRGDFKDVHSAKFDNSPGQTHEMPRNQVSDDPATPCHEGFHVGALAYAQSFGPRVVICKVDPENVVSVPNDYSCQKMRVCKYTVEGHYAIQLPDTVLDESSLDEDDIFFDFAEDDCDCTDSDLAEGRHEVVCLAQEESPEPVEVPKKWEKYQGMSSTELLELPIMLLRQYAYKALKIVGASKIPGGKVNLITRILDVRGATKK